MVDIKHIRLNHTVIHLKDHDLANFAVNFSMKANKAPKFFQNANIIIDSSSITKLITNETVTSIRQSIALTGANLIGIINAKEEHKVTFAQMGIPHVDSRKETITQTEQTSHNNIMFKKFIRSGMQVYAKNQTLVIQGNVSNGAEVIADGHIICLGKLSGKAIAGASGDITSQIMAVNFTPELISIAGIYALHEDICDSHRNTSSLVSLQNGALSFESNSTSKLVF